MSTRNGKIARLPRAVREQLNRRLDEGEPGKRLVAWLNGLPETQAVLGAEFGGRPINEQNLSEWRRGGYQDWQKQQERRHLVRELVEDAEELRAVAGDVEVSQHLSAVLGAEFAESARALLATLTDPAERWEQLQELLRELARMRREDHRAGRLQFERERRARERAEEERAEAHRRELAPYDRLLMRSGLADLFSQPDLFSQAMGVRQAEVLLLGAESRAVAAPGSSSPNQSKSN